MCIRDSDNPVTLSDGNVAWSFVGNDNVLKIYSLGKLASSESDVKGGNYSENDAIDNDQKENENQKNNDVNQDISEVSTKYFKKCKKDCFFKNCSKITRKTNEFK